MDFYVLGQGAPSCFNVLFSSSAGTVPPTDDSLGMLSLLLSLLLEFSFSALAGQTQRPMGSHSGLYVKWACCVRHIFIYRSFVVITTEGLSCGFLVHSYLIKLVITSSVMCFLSVGMTVEKCTANENPSRFSLMALNAWLLMEKEWKSECFPRC